MRMYFLKIVTKGNHNIPPLIHFSVERPKHGRVKKDVSEMLEKYLSVENGESKRSLPVCSIKGGIFGSGKDYETLWEALSLVEFLVALDEWEKAGN